MKSQTLIKEIKNKQKVKLKNKTEQKNIKLIDEEFYLHPNSNSICRISTKNTIKFCNFDFINNSCFTEKELLNKSYSLIYHPEMPKVISDFIKNFIKNGKTVDLIVKNKTKTGKYYWTYSSFKPNKGENLNIAFTVTSKPISLKTKTNIAKLYACLSKLEKETNEIATLKYLIGFLESKKMSLTTYTEHLISL